MRPAGCIRGFFDGSVHGKRAAFGWIVLGSSCGDSDMSSWQIVAHKSGCLPDGATIAAVLKVPEVSDQRALDNISTYGCVRLVRARF